MSQVNPFESAAFRIGDWVAEPPLGRLSRGDTATLLEPKTMAVLQHLAARPGEVISGDYLVEQVWNGRPMGDNPVYKCIAQLRKALGDDAHKPVYIATVPKRGYRLLAAVRPAGPADESPPLQPVRRMSAHRPLVAGIALVCTLLVLAAVSLRPGIITDSAPGGDSSAKALAILPFSTRGEPPLPGLTGEGIAQELSSQLAGNRQMRVIAFGSSSAVRQEGVDPGDAARRLQASHVLTGEMSAERERIIVDVALLTASGDELWAHRYDHAAAAPGTLLDTISRDVAGNLRIELDNRLNASCGGTRSVEACQLYLMAHEHVRKRSDGYKATATDLMQQAIARDPEYAVAHADLGSFYLLPGYDIPWAEAMELARTSIERALELDENLAEAHAARGLALLKDERGPCPPTCYDVDGYADAEPPLRKAIELKPGLAPAHNWLAISLYGQGRIDEAHARLRTALSYDPLNPAINYNMALFTAYAGDMAEARQQVNEFQQHHPNPPMYMHAMLARIADYSGHYHESLEYARKLIDDPAASHYLDIMASAYQNLGMFEHLSQLLEGLDNPSSIDELYAIARADLLSVRNQMRELAEFTDVMIENARSEYGDPDHWPRWLVRIAGRNKALLGLHDQAVDYLGDIYLAGHARLDHQALIDELDGLHFLAFSLQKLGREDEANTALDKSLDVIRDWEGQGYADFPDLAYAKARTHALYDNRALAVATLSQAVSLGWKRYWRIHTDPRWNPMRQEADFRQILVQVRDHVEAMRDRTGTEWAAVD